MPFNAAVRAAELMALAPRSCHKEWFENSSYRATKLSHMSAPQAQAWSKWPRVCSSEAKVRWFKTCQKNARILACSRGRMALFLRPATGEAPLPSWRRNHHTHLWSSRACARFSGRVPPSLSAIVPTLTGWVHRSPMNHLMQSDCHKALWRYS